MAPTQTADTIDASAPLEVVGARTVLARVSDLLAWECYIDDPARVEELHAMRIAAKRLRYTMEIFAPFFGKDFRAAIAQVKRVQELLGHVHDADVMVPELADYLRRLLDREVHPNHHNAVIGVHSIDVDAAQGILTLCRERTAFRDAQYQSFLATWRQMRREGFFDRLWTLVNQNSAKEDGAAIANGTGKARKIDPPTSGGETNDATANGRRRRPAAASSHRPDPSPLPAPGDSGIELVRSRWRGTRHRLDTRPGPDPGEGAEESGL